MSFRGRPSCRSRQRNPIEIGPTLSGVCKPAALPGRRSHYPRRQQDPVITTDHPTRCARDWGDLLLALSLPLADHLLRPIYFWPEGGFPGRDIAGVAIFVIAPLMYRYVERRFIHSSEAAPVTFWKYAAGFWSIILPMVAITHTTFLLKGFAWRLPQEQAELAHLQEFSSVLDIEPVDGPLLCN